MSKNCCLNYAEMGLCGLFSEGQCSMQLILYSRVLIIQIPIIQNIGYPKANSKPKLPKPKANIAGFLAGTWRQAPFILPTMSSKRKHVVLSFTDKLKIDQWKNGASGSSLAQKYGVGNATIPDIKKE
ncbi:hypothetical protein LAZ67_2004631 [Cordylochernes scorpioides]|uniref:Uncharacterized protein n=1 Tax=Cordylochernes scorpioides TaxID=51811 RepID=A0ABY6K5F9_9ARAC|nr:hypothetical protein LAZ67_2004631 [Cordylochernes scorpioides]